MTVQVIGFTASGVAARSIAAGIQAGIGNVSAGSAFAGMQSIAATGALTTALPVVLVIGAAGGAGYAIYKYKTNKNWCSSLIKYFII